MSVFVLAAALATVAGCSSVSKSWSQAIGDSDFDQPQAHASFAIGPFANPGQSTPGWSNIGAGMSDAVRQKLLQRDKQLDLRSDAVIVGAVQRALDGPPSQFADKLRNVRSLHPGVRYVIVGQVTDFMHKPLKPQDISKWGPARNRCEAVSAVQLTVVDMENRRIALNDHVEASAWASDAAAARTYQGVSFGSYRFWETPLGLASKDVIDRAAARIAELSPLRNDEPIRIVDRLTERRVSLSEDAAARVSPGDVLLVCVYDKSGTRLEPVMDAATRSPLQARVESTRPAAPPTAWLLGEPPAGMALRKAVLCTQSPKTGTGAGR